MFGLIAFILAVIGAAVAWFDKGVSVQHLFVFVFVIFACLAIEGAWGWAPWKRP